MPVERSAGAIIFRKEKDKFFFLLLHYPSSSSRAETKGEEEGLPSSPRSSKSYWDLPKGHIEGKEKIEETARREVEEETGLKDLKFVPGFSSWMKYFFRSEGKTVFKIVTYLLAETKTEEIKISPEHIGYQWLPYREALNQLTFKNAKEILKKANEFLSEKCV